MSEQEPKPDFTHTGHVVYKIDFYGNNAQIQILGQQNYYDKIAIHHIVKEDMNLLIEELKKNKKKVNKHFVQLDSQRAKSARYIIEKFIHQFLGVALHLQKNGVSAPESTPEDVVHEESGENPSAPEIIKDRRIHITVGDPGSGTITTEFTGKKQDQPGGESVSHREGEL